MTSKQTHQSSSSLSSLLSSVRSLSTLQSVAFSDQPSRLTSLTLRRLFHPPHQLLPLSTPLTLSLQELKQSVPFACRNSNKVRVYKCWRNVIMGSMSTASTSGSLLAPPVQLAGLLSSHNTTYTLHHQWKLLQARSMLLSLFPQFLLLRTFFIDLYHVLLLRLPCLLLCSR